MSVCEREKLRDRVKGRKLFVRVYVCVMCVESEADTIRVSRLSVFGEGIKVCSEKPMM